MSTAGNKCQNVSKMSKSVKNVRKCPKCVKECHKVSKNVTTDKSVKCIKMCMSKNVRYVKKCQKLSTNVKTVQQCQNVSKIVKNVIPLAPLYSCYIAN